jgi:hypothetical protein
MPVQGGQASERPLQVKQADINAFHQHLFGFQENVGRGFDEGVL